MRVCVCVCVCTCVCGRVCVCVCVRVWVCGDWGCVYVATQGKGPTRTLHMLFQAGGGHRCGLGEPVSAWDSGEAGVGMCAVWVRERVCGAAVRPV